MRINFARTYIRNEELFEHPIFFEEKTPEKDFFLTLRLIQRDELEEST